MSTTTTKETPFERAIRLAGGQAQLGKALGVGQSFISQIAIGHRPLPPRHAPEIERVTGVRCEELAPAVAWKRGRDGRVIAFEVQL